MLLYRIRKMERTSMRSFYLTGKARDSSLLPRQVRTSKDAFHLHSPHSHIHVVSIICAIFGFLFLRRETSLAVDA